MEVYEREFLVSKIILGKSILKIKEDLVLIVEPLTTEKNFFAQKAYKNAYDDAFFSGVYTRKEMLSILEETGTGSGQVVLIKIRRMHLMCFIQ